MLAISRALHVTRDMAGVDFGGQFFGAIYDPVAKQIPIVWERLVMALGGVTEGLTVTANHFVTAEWHSTHGADPVPVKPVPQYHDFTYHAPASASGVGYQNLASFPFHIAEDIATLQFILKIFPRGHQDRLRTAQGLWKRAATAVGDLSYQVNSILQALTIDDHAAGVRPGLTQGRVDTWQAAMKQFCSRIWGTAPWDGPNANPAPLHVLGNAATDLANSCASHAHAIDETRSRLEARMGEAAFATLLALVLGEATGGILDLVVEQFDEAMLADCGRILVEYYYNPVNAIRSGFDGSQRLAELGHARDRVPTLQAMEAQSESVGDRALHDFTYPGLNNSNAPGKGSKGRPVPGATPYGVDLAGQEGIDGAHVIDKHVGKTNLQLSDRFDNDPANPSSSSSFNDLPGAQKYVQDAINANRDKMSKVVQGQSGTSFSYKDPSGSVTGRNWENGHLTNVHSVKVVIKRDGSLDPPFVVTTAYPEPP